DLVDAGRRIQLALEERLHAHAVRTGVGEMLPGPRRAAVELDAHRIPAIGHGGVRTQLPVRAPVGLGAARHRAGEVRAGGAQVRRERGPVVVAVPRNRQRAVIAAEGERAMVTAGEAAFTPGSAE